MATQGMSYPIMPHPLLARLPLLNVSVADRSNRSICFPNRIADNAVAKITLKSLNGEAVLPERTLTLHPHLRTIQIGRASKSPSKGLQAAVENAWFDSPVMSRNHAEISMNAESNVITIQDIGSMHGTFVNDLQLERHEPSELSDGDLVVFGAEVKRNLDTFPACAFRVNYEFLPFKYVQYQSRSSLPCILKKRLNFLSRAINSYAFPESDEEDYDISDDEVEANEEPSSEDGVSIESPVHKASQVIDAIDLTRDESPAISYVAGVDSTSHIRKTLIHVMADPPAGLGDYSDAVNVPIYNGKSPILLDSEDEDHHFASNSDDHFGEVEYDDGASSSDEDSMDEQQDPENTDGNDHEMNRDVEDRPEQASRLAGLGLYSLLDAPLPESNLRTIIDVSEDIIQEGNHDDESDFGLSDAGAEGIRALFDDRLVDNEGDSYADKEMDDDCKSDSVFSCKVTTTAPMVVETLQTPKQSTFASIPSEQLTEMSSGYVNFNEHDRTFGKLEAPSHSTMSARQPSPSDAAMVKTAAPSITLLNQTANPARVHHFPSLEFQNLTAQSLGYKTGKHAFFAAREDNKAKVHSAENGQSEGSSWLQNTETTTSLTVEEKRQRSMVAMERFRERKRRVEEASKATPVLPVPGLPATADFCKLSKAEEDRKFLTSVAIPPFATLPYLDDHTQPPNAVRSPSPEPDMTSAVTYNQSKASMASNNKHNSGRSGLSIHDIIEGAADDHASNSLKRKADDISEAIENEVRVWASSSPVLNDTEISSGISAASQAAVSEVQSKTAPPLNIPEQRPSKRLRKIVESVGYVALGGATLFGALVLSAPDFL